MRGAEEILLKEAGRNFKEGQRLAKRLRGMMEEALRPVGAAIENLADPKFREGLRYIRLNLGFRL